MQQRVKRRLWLSRSLSSLCLSLPSLSLFICSYLCMQNTLGYSRHRLQRRLLCACCARLVLSNARQHHKNVIPMQGLLLRAGKDKGGAGRERGAGTALPFDTVGGIQSTYALLHCAQSRRRRRSFSSGIRQRQNERFVCFRLKSK